MGEDKERLTGARKITGGVDMTDTERREAELRAIMSAVAPKEEKKPAKKPAKKKGAKK